MHRTGARFSLSSGQLRRRDLRRSGSHSAPRHPVGACQCATSAQYHQDRGSFSLVAHFEPGHELMPLHGTSPAGGARASKPAATDQTPGACRCDRAGVTVTGPWVVGGGRDPPLLEAPTGNEARRWIQKHRKPAQRIHASRLRRPLMWTLGTATWKKTIGGQHFEMRCRLTVRLLVASTGGAATELLGLAAAGIGDEECAVVGHQDVLDLLLLRLIDVPSHTPYSRPTQN